MVSDIVDTVGERWGPALAAANLPQVTRGGDSRAAAKWGRCEQMVNSRWLGAVMVGCFSVTALDAMMKWS